MQLHLNRFCIHLSPSLTLYKVPPVVFTVFKVVIESENKVLAVNKLTQGIDLQI